MRRILLSLAALVLMALPGLSQDRVATDILAEHRALIEKPTRAKIAPVIAELAASGDPVAATVLAAWAEKGLGLRKADGVFFLIEATADGWALRDLTGADAGVAAKSDVVELRPNAGVRGLIATALVQFTLSDPDPALRAEALESIARDPEPDHLMPLRASLETEADPMLRAQKARLERLLTLRFDEDSAARVAAIDSFGADMGLDLRGALNPLLATDRIAFVGDLPEGANLARNLTDFTDGLDDFAKRELLLSRSEFKFGRGRRETQRGHYTLEDLKRRFLRQN